MPEERSISRYAFFSYAAMILIIAASRNASDELARYWNSMAVMLDFPKLHHYGQYSTPIICALINDCTKQSGHVLTRFDADLLEDILDVLVHGSRRDKQPRRDEIRIVAPAQKGGDLSLAFREAAPDESDIVGVRIVLWLPGSKHDGAIDQMGLDRLDYCSVFRFESASPALALLTYRDGAETSLGILAPIGSRRQIRSIVHGLDSNPFSISSTLFSSLVSSITFSQKKQ